MIRSTALNATTRIRAQKLPTIVERLRKLAENLFFTDGDLLLHIYIVHNYQFLQKLYISPNYYIYTYVQMYVMHIYFKTNLMVV